MWRSPQDVGVRLPRSHNRIELQNCLNVQSVEHPIFMYYVTTFSWLINNNNNNNNNNNRVHRSFLGTQVVYESFPFPSFGC